MPRPTRQIRERGMTDSLMHRIDRGSEPAGLAEIRKHYTSRWILYYQEREGNRPGDTHWREFRDDLHRVFQGLCAYCEARSNEEVDHFRPVSQFPELVYQWSNWLLVCTACNRAKGSKWPPMGYVDPCTEFQTERPEAYFTFDTLTGSILPRPDLNLERHDRAKAMIDDLDLNGRQHLRNRKEAVEGLERLAWIAVKEHLISQARLEETFVCLAARHTPLSSIIRVWLHEQGYRLTT